MPLAVAALPVIIVAIVAMIVLWGLALLFKSLLQSMANHIPVIGGPIARSIGALIDTAVTLGADAARAVVADAVGFILAPVYWIERHITSVINFFTNLVDAIRYITGTLIPGEVAALEKQITTAYNDAVHYAQALGNAILVDLAHDVAALQQEITAAETALEHYAQALVASAEAYTAAAIAAETSFVQATAAGLQSEITQVAAAEASYAQTLYTDATGYAQSLVTQAETTLAADLTDVIDYVNAADVTLAAAITAMGTQVIALTLDAVATVESDLSDLKTECTDNLCSGLSDLASLFNDLQGDLGLAALFVLAAEFASDPRKAAADVQSTLGTVAQDAAGAVRDLIGL